MPDLPPLLKAALQLRAETDLSQLFLPAMTDPLEPNDLSHLSDEEFHALCPIGEHAPGPEPLSPAAQAVLEAVITDNQTGPERFHARAHAAAALRAAADQVAPLSGRLGKGYRQHRSANAERLAIRRDLLAIAAELEGTNGCPPPATRVIVAAFDDRYELCGPFDDNWQELCLAAALRVLADH